MFVGYPKGTRGGLFYSHSEKKVFTSTNATFLENDYVQNFKPRSKVVLEEMVKELTPTNVPPSSTRVEDEIPTLHVQPTQVDLNEESTTVPEQTVTKPRHSGRVSKNPVRYGLDGETNMVVGDTSDDDLLSFKQAMASHEKEQWVEAMKQEMESMYSNSVWDLVEAPSDFRAIGCKWIYKKKRGVDGNIETYKARLVAKGYTQREGVDYEETFSPVAMLKSIRILLSIAAALVYEIWKMDIKTTFLNGKLDKVIYMDQPEGFKVVGQEIRQAE